jgi:hypothetical protein
VIDRRKYLRRFVRSLKIHAKGGRRVALRDVMRPEQEQVLDAWIESPRSITLKPRQIGVSTILQACLFADGYFATDGGGSSLTMTHESGSTGRMNRMLRNYWKGLDPALRLGRLDPDNAHQIGFPHNEWEFIQYMAGGRGQGRSYTFRQVVFDEMAFYPQGSASVKSAEDADEDAYSSVMSTVDEESPYFKVAIASTGEGPGGIFHRMWQQTKDDPAWRRIFFPWKDFPMYGREPRAGLAETLTPEERELVDAHGLNLRQLEWRRHKLYTDGYSLQRFRREYPLTDEEPFLLHSSTWFDAELLNKIKARIPARWRANAFVGPLRVYHQPEPGRTYFAGGDTSGGTGGDTAVLVILREDYEVACVWASNTEKPDGQADAWAELCAWYNAALACVEENKYGRQVSDRMEEQGAVLWRDEKGKRYWTQLGKAGESKLRLYGYARQMVDGALCCSAAPDHAPRINDEDICHEMMVIRENGTGNIEAPPDQHDDFADAYALALWSGRWHSVHRSRPPEDVARDSRLEAMVGRRRR